MNNKQKRINALLHKALTEAEALLEANTAPPPPPPDPPTAATVRRQTANIYGAWQVCANSKCRRARCCRGEPLNCLRYGMVMLPTMTGMLAEPALAGLLKMRRPHRLRPKRRRKPKSVRLRAPRSTRTQQAKTNSGNDF